MEMNERDLKDETRKLLWTGGGEQKKAVVLVMPVLHQETSFLGGRASGISLTINNLQSVDGLQQSKSINQHSVFGTRPGTEGGFGSHHPVHHHNAKHLTNGQSSLAMKKLIHSYGCDKVINFF